MTRLATLILALLLIAPAMSQQNSVSFISPSGGFGDILLWVNFENCGASPCTSYTIGANEYSAGDTTFTFNGGAQITSAAALDGSYGLDIDADAPDYIQLDVSSGDIINPAQGRVGFKLQRVNLASGNPIIWIAYNDPEESASVRNEFGAGNNAVRGRWDDNVNTVANTGITSVLTQGQEYCVEMSWDSASDDMTIYLDSVDQSVSFSGTMNELGVPSAVNAPELLRLGNSNPSDTGTYYIDTFAISSNPNRDLCTLFASSGNYPG